jgi:hypothetical protein
MAVANSMLVDAHAQQIQNGPFGSEQLCGQHKLELGSAVANAAVTSSFLQPAQVVGHVDGVLSERFQGHHIEGAFMRVPAPRGPRSLVVGQKPVHGCDAPAVAAILM